MRMALMSFFLLAPLAACGGGSPEESAPVAIGSLDAPVAGRTMSCDVAGSRTTLTFAANGGLSGRMLDQPVTGRWYATGGRSVHTHIRAGSVGVHDELRPQGGRWVGRLATCS